MRMSTAYFAGAGTVAAAVVVGIGGGLVIAEMMNPKSPVLEQTKFERRTANPAPQASNAPAPQASNPGGSEAGSSYLAATQAATNAAVVVAPAAAKAPEPPAVEQAAQSPTPPTAANTQQPQPSPEPTQQRTGAPEKAFAKAQDSDVKPREAEARQRAERQRTERRQRWMERRQAQRGRDQELRDVEQAVREDMPRREERPPRAYIAEPVEVDTPQLRQAPQVRLFDDDN